MKYIKIVGGIFPLFLLFITTFAFSCELKQTCNAGENEILRFSSLTNAHFELPLYKNYSYILCCEKASLKISDTCGGGFASLSSDSNAHAAEYGVYPINLCLEDESGKGFFSCSLKNYCSGPETCLFSLSSNVNAHGGECTEYPYKVCCNYTPYIGIEIKGSQIIDVSAGELVNVYMSIRNNYNVLQEVEIFLDNIIHGISGSLEEVTAEWRERYIIDFCEVESIGKEECKANAENTFSFAPGEEKIFLFKVVIPFDAKLLSNYTANFTVTSKTLGAVYKPYVIYRIIGGKIGIVVNAMVTDTMGNPQKNREISICICESSVEWCDEQNAIYVFKASTDEVGVLYVQITPVLELGERYKLSLVTEKGYAEAIIET